MWGRFEFVLPLSTLVWSTPLGLSRAMCRTHAPTFNKWQQQKKKMKMVALHMLTHGAMRRCGLTSLVVCIDDKFCDMRERNVTIRSEIWIMNIGSLGFRDIRECVTLWGLILRRLGCSLVLMGYWEGPLCTWGRIEGQPKLWIIGPIGTLGFVESSPRALY